METLLGVAIAAVLILSTIAVMAIFSQSRGPRRGTAFRVHH